MNTKSIVSFVILFALVSWVACDGGTGESTGTGPESQDAGDSSSAEKSKKTTTGWTSVKLNLGDIYPVMELQVPANWVTRVTKENFQFDEYMNAMIFEGGRTGETKEEAESIPKDEILRFRVEGIWRNVLKSREKVAESHWALQHSSVIGDSFAEYDVEKTQIAVDGVGATQYRYERLVGEDRYVWVPILVSSDDPRMLCGAFGFYIYAYTRLTNEAAIHDVIDRISVSNPKTPIYESCDDPKQAYSQFLDSFLPDADIYISDLKIKPCREGYDYTYATAKITNKGDSTTYGSVNVRYLTYTAGGE